MEQNLHFLSKDSFFACRANSIGGIQLGGISSEKETGISIINGGGPLRRACHRGLGGRQVLGLRFELVGLFELLGIDPARTARGGAGQPAPGDDAYLTQNTAPPQTVHQTKMAISPASGTLCRLTIDSTGAGM